LGVADAGDEYERLVAAYSEPHRHYHNTGHVANCLTRLDEYRSEARCLDEVEVALWFHDAIYKPRSRSNEFDSAEWARDFLVTNGVGEDTCARVYGHILATRHDGAPDDGDAGLVVDLDLSILGHLYPGMAFLIREGSKAVAYGSVTAILDLVKSAERMGARA
jgi:predicted metal-dependent HD superfamily phosphohydrolase